MNKTSDQRAAAPAPVRRNSLASMRPLSAAGAMLAMLITITPAPAASSLSGTWVSEDMDTTISVSTCENGALCGSLVSLREPNDATGKPKTDARNPDLTKRTQPLVGVRIFYDMKPSGSDVWTGKLYRVDDGTVVDGQLIAKSASEIRIQGCLLGICGGQSWTRERGAAPQRGRRR